MDPGTCPECGHTVDVGKLAKSRLPARIRNLDRGKIVGALIVLIVTAWIVQYYAGWLTLLPTEVLLLLQGNVKSDTTLELHRRCVAGDLSESQIRRMILRNLTFSESVRSPAPADVFVTLNFTWSAALPIGLELYSDGWKVLVDGEYWASEYHHGLYFMGGAYSGTCFVGAREPGSHEVTMEQTFRVTANANLAQGLNNLNPIIFARSARVVLEITDKPLVDFVKRPLTTQPVDELTKEFLAHIRFHPELNRYVLRIKAPPLTRRMTWDLQLRPPGVRALSWFGRLHANEDESLDKVMTIEVDERLPRVDQLDMQLVSDRCDDFNAGLGTYVDVTVEWRGLMVHSVTPEEREQVISDKGGITETYAPATSVIERLD